MLSSSTGRVKKHMSLLFSLSHLAWQAQQVTVSRRILPWLVQPRAAVFAGSRTRSTTVLLGVAESTSRTRILWPAVGSRWSCLAPALDFHRVPAGIGADQSWSHRCCYSCFAAAAAAAGCACRTHWDSRWPVGVADFRPTLARRPLYLVESIEEQLESWLVLEIEAHLGGNLPNSLLTP